MAKRSKPATRWDKVVASTEKWDDFISERPIPSERRGKSAPSKSRLSPLLQAAERGDVKAIETLIHGGANIHETADPKMASYHGADALILASRHGHVDAVKALLRHGAKPTTEGGLGSALDEAVTYGHADVVKLLLAEGARNFSFSLFNALEQGYVEIFRVVAEAGIPLQMFRSRHGDSLLERAIRRKKDEVVEFLLDAGIKPIDGGPLVECAARGDVEMTRLLLRHGADPNQVNRMRRFPLGMACSRGHKNVIAVLLDHGADLTLVYVRGWSCGDWAKHGQHEELLNWLDSKAKEKGLKIPRSTSKAAV